MPLIPLYYKLFVLNSSETQFNLSMCLFADRLVAISKILANSSVLYLAFLWDRTIAWALTLIFRTIPCFTLVFPYFIFFCKLSSVISTLSVNRSNVGQNKDKASPPPSHLLSGCSSCIAPFTMSNVCKFMQMYANWALVIIRLNGFSMVSLENYPLCGNKSLWGCWLW